MLWKIGDKQGTSKRSSGWPSNIHALKIRFSTLFIVKIHVNSSS